MARRANALVLLDSGWSCEKVAKALFLDRDHGGSAAKNKAAFDKLGDGKNRLSEPIDTKAYDQTIELVFRSHRDSGQ